MNSLSSLFTSSTASAWLLCLRCDGFPPTSEASTLSQSIAWSIVQPCRVKCKTPHATGKFICTVHLDEEDPVENHQVALRCYSFLGKAAHVPRKSNSPSKAALLVSGHHIALTIQFNACSSADPESHHHHSVPCRSQHILYQMMDV